MIDELNEQLATFQSRSANNSASKLTTPSNKQIGDSTAAEIDAGLTNAYLGIDNRFPLTQIVPYIIEVIILKHILVLLLDLRERVLLLSFP